MMRYCHRRDCIHYHQPIVEDLKAERQKAIETILTMNQFPAGMEMFSAANEEQWEIIKETIDCSDYYVLIVGNKYGSIDPASGISYTEKEFDYAVRQKIPVLAFVIANDVSTTADNLEKDPVKAAGLLNFKSKVKTGRMVKFWHNADELAAQLSQSIFKAISRSNRPGWIRTTEFDIEKSYAEILRLTERVHTLEALNADLKIENSRSPHLWIRADKAVGDDGKIMDENVTIKDSMVYLKVMPVDLSDAEKGIDYNDYAGRTIHADKNEVRLFRHLYKNAFPLDFSVHNDGNARATGVRVNLQFPNALLVMSIRELYEYMEAESLTVSEDSHKNWEFRFFEPENSENSKTEKESMDDRQKFISIDELTVIKDITNLLDPADWNEVVSIFPGEVNFDKTEVRHKDCDLINGVCILPTSSGKHTIKANIICIEYTEAVTQEIFVIVE